MSRKFLQRASSHSYGSSQRVRAPGGPGGSRHHSQLNPKREKSEMLASLYLWREGGTLGNWSSLNREADRALHFRNLKRKDSVCMR